MRFLNLQIILKTIHDYHVQLSRIFQRVSNCIVTPIAKLEFIKTKKLKTGVFKAACRVPEL